jgi:ribose-phosphate pyrophosphokinase
MLAPLIRQFVRAPFYLVAPDAGALKKTHKLAQTLTTRDPHGCIGVVESSKLRNTQTGEITGTVVHASGLIRSVTVGDQDVPIVYVMADDICDGGRTFIELAKELRGMGADVVHLYVTHGFFTKGKGVFTGIIDEVHAINDQSKFEWDKVSS